MNKELKQFSRRIEKEFNPEYDLCLPFERPIRKFLSLIKKLWTT